MTTARRDVPHLPELSPDLRGRGVGRIAASRGPRLASPDLSTAPPALPVSFLKARIGPGLRVIHCCYLPGGSHKSPPSAGPSSDPALAPSAGPPGGSTLGIERGAAQRVGDMEPSRAQGRPKPPKRVTPLQNRGHRSGTLLGRQVRARARSQAKRTRAVPAPQGTHARPESPHSRASRSSPASRKCLKKIERARVHMPCFKTPEKQLCCVQT